MDRLRRKPSKTIDDPSSYAVSVDKKDLLIVKELQKNARRSFADLSPLLGISLQGVKYHYDKKLVPPGIVKYFRFDVWPYPEEVSAYHEILLKFANSQDMNRFYSSMDDFFFVLGISKILHQNSLLIRTYTLQAQVPSLFTFLSQMVQEGLLESYSAVRHDFMEREVQTIPYELFDQDQGWIFNLKQYRSELSKLGRAATVRRRV
jgi:DNA-binding Lrp family transcriptional regulator